MKNEAPPTESGGFPIDFLVIGERAAWRIGITGGSKIGPGET